MGISNFNTVEPKLKLLLGGWPLQLEQEVVYRPPKSLYKRPISVPRGFITDLASVPKVFFSILPPFGKYSLAALVHDFLYEKQNVKRKIADKILLEAMKDLGVNPVVRFIIFRAVRLGGWAAWGRKKKHRKTFNRSAGQ